MSPAEIDDFERWLESQARSQAEGATDRVLEQWQYAAAVGVKKGFREALAELRTRRTRGGALPEDGEET